MRITHNMLSQRVMDNLYRNLNNVARIQEVLSTGRQFRLPEQSPISYIKSLNLREELNRNRRYQRNIDIGNTNLQLTESTLSSITDRLQRARELTISGINGTLDVQSRSAVSDEVTEIFSSLVELANSNFEGRYLFSGDSTQRKAFDVVSVGEGINEVLYRGDSYNRDLEINQGEIVSTNLTGLKAFFSSVNEVTSSQSVDPDLLLAPQLAGATPPVTAVPGTFEVDGVTIAFDPTTDTLVNIRDAINRNVETAEAEITDDGQLVVRSLRSIDVEMKTVTSNVLESLGMFHRVEGGTIGAGLTPATTLAALGINGDAIEIDTGEEVFQIDLAGAATLNDLFNSVATSGAPVVAFVNSTATGVVFSASASVEDLEVRSLRKIFGSTAIAPGTITNDTTLASLGITTGEIQVNNDGNIDLVDLTGLTTVEQVVTTINNQLNGVVATINDDGTAIDIESQFFSSTLSVSDVGASNLAATLGFAQTRNDDNAADFDVTGVATVNEQEGRNIFNTLSTLAAALKDGGSTEETFAGVLSSLDRELEHILQNRSSVGATLNRLDSSQGRFQAFEVYLTELLSKNEDADLSDAITQLSTQSNVLQAALAAGAKIIQPTLLNFLQ